MKPFSLFAIILFTTHFTVSAQNIFTIAGTYSGNGQTAFSLGIVPAVQVTDAAGNIYFSEPDRHLVRKLSINGIYSIVAGTGIAGYSGDGNLATTAQLKRPFAIALDTTGNLYIGDNQDQRIRKVSTTGIITTIAGTGVAGFSGDGGPAVQAQINSPSSIVVDRNGNLYFSDVNNLRVRKIGSNGTITTIVGNGIFGTNGNGGSAVTASIGVVSSIALNASGELFVADVVNNNIRKVGINGVINAFAGPVNGSSGFSGDGGPAAAALFNGVVQVAVDGLGNVYVADANNNRVRKINGSGTISTIAGNGGTVFGGDGGPATAAQLPALESVSTDAAGNILINTGMRIRKVATNNIINTVAGIGTAAYHGDSLPAASAQIFLPRSLAVSKQFEIYWADPASNVVRKLTTAGTIITVAGTGMAGFNGDGASAKAAQLNAPDAIAIDTSGNVFIGDAGNRRIRKVDSNGIITTVAGNGNAGTDGDGGPALLAQITPRGLAVDKQGNIYFSNQSGSYRIRRISTNGIVTTIAGNGAFGLPGSGDGGLATAASISSVPGITIDSAGNVLFIDLFNYSIRKVDMATGIINTVAGNGRPDFSGDGGLATAAGISSPNSITIDTANNILIADGGGYIRKVNAAGIITSIAGGGSTYAENVPAIGTDLGGPISVASDALGSLYLSDANNRIRKIALSCRSWTGAVSGNWENSGNWTCGLLPDATTDVVIRSGTIRINSDVVVRSLKLDPSVNLIVGSGYTLTVLQ